jgi:hypothetical protein
VPRLAVLGDQLAPLLLRHGRILSGSRNPVLRRKVSTGSTTGG